MGKKGRRGSPRWKTNPRNGSPCRVAECHPGKQDFPDVGHGYRPNRSAKETVANLIFNRKSRVLGGYIVEADIESYFDTIDRDGLPEMPAQRIDDRAFLHLIRKGG